MPGNGCCAVHGSANFGFADLRLSFALPPSGIQTEALRHITMGNYPEARQLHVARPAQHARQFGRGYSKPTGFRTKPANGFCPAL